MNADHFLTALGAFAGAASTMFILVGIPVLRVVRAMREEGVTLSDLVSVVLSTNRKAEAIKRHLDITPNPFAEFEERLSDDETTRIKKGPAEITQSHYRRPKK